MPAIARSGVAALQRAQADGVEIVGVLPSPPPQSLGLAPLVFFAECRLALGNTPVTVFADFEAMGHRSAQMALAFGANALFGPIVAERALRLGDNANNPS